ncbi:gamma-glutamylcyclotransferase family protein [Halomonas cupida]|uniref:gamma-glutamylcyclotransferase family protein n=1 Tax=Halomonas cupida TaxID=44933 RepID=UPI003A92B2CB
MSWYFAYGSNMNEARVEARIGAVRRVMPGVLEGFRLSFNKASRVAGISHANVVSCAASRVEGALFELAEVDQILAMDPFEGYPSEYQRHWLPIRVEHGVVEAWVYIAGPDRTAEALKPAREYLNHLLAGEAFLSPDYHRQLAAVEVVEGLDDDTLARLGLSRQSPR